MVRLILFIMITAIVSSVGLTSWSAMVVDGKIDSGNC